LPRKPRGTSHPVLLREPQTGAPLPSGSQSCENRTMKFLLVDDHALFRHGLLLLLAKLPGTHTFLESASCEEAFAEAAAHADIDLILLDLALPGMNGLDGLAKLRDLCPTVPVIFLSASENSRFIVEGLRGGAQGFIPKSTSPEAIMAALQVIFAGGTYVPARN
jgi:two-component system nitrate/nitrite response regulator NarL